MMDELRWLGNTTNKEAEAKTNAFTIQKESR